MCSFIFPENLFWLSSKSKLFRFSFNSTRHTFLAVLPPCAVMFVLFLFYIRESLTFHSSFRLHPSTWPQFADSYRHYIYFCFHPQLLLNQSNKVQSVPAHSLSSHLVFLFNPCGGISRKNATVHITNPVTHQRLWKDKERRDGATASPEMSQGLEPRCGLLSAALTPLQLVCVPPPPASLASVGDMGLLPMATTAWWSCDKMSVWSGWRGWVMGDGWWVVGLINGR